MVKERILTYNEIDREEWGRLVQTSATGTWFQTPEAYCFFASMPNLFKPFVVGLASPEDRLVLRGVCVGYVTVEKCAIKQMMTRRAIILGGPALADDCTDKEVILLLRSLTRPLVNSFIHSPIYIETRNFNSYAKWKDAFAAAVFEYRPHLNFHVDCTDSEKMWERLSENRKRQIRHARGAGVTIADLRLEIADFNSAELEIREWYDILEKLYRTKVKTPLWPVEFFLEAYRQGIGKYLMVKHEGKVIGGMMMVEWRDTVYEWFECGLNAQYKDQYPSVFATFAGMCYAAENGITRYDMMGAGEPDLPYGVRDFKSEFGGKMVEHGRFLYIAKPMLYQIGKLGVKILKRMK